MAGGGYSQQVLNNGLIANSCRGALVVFSGFRYAFSNSNSALEFKGKGGPVGK